MSNRGDRTSYLAEWFQKNKERVRMRELQRRHSNPDILRQLREAAKRRRDINLETSRKKEKERRNKRGREQVLEAERRYWSKPGNLERKLQQQREWKMNNPERNLASYIKRCYGITLEEYEVLCKSQDYVCAICQMPEFKVNASTGELQRLSVDHCHETGKIRGALCGNCNRAIGLLRENPEIVRAAADYLERHQ